MALRDCPACGFSFQAIKPYCVCTRCGHRFTALPTQILLAGTLGRTTEEQLLVRIAGYHRVPFLSTLDFPIAIGTLECVGERFARMHCTVPLIIDGRERFVVLDPDCPDMFDEAVRLLNRLPDCAVSYEELIRRKITDHFGVRNSPSPMEITPLPREY